MNDGGFRLLVMSITLVAAFLLTLAGSGTSHQQLKIRVEIEYGTK